MLLISNISLNEFASGLGEVMLFFPPAPFSYEKQLPLFLLFAAEGAICSIYISTMGQRQALGVLFHQESSTGQKV